MSNHADFIDDFTSVITFKIYPEIERLANFYINKLISDKAEELLPKIDYDWRIPEVYEHPLLKQKFPADIELPNIIGYLDMNREYGGSVFGDTEPIIIKKTIFVTLQGKCFQLSDDRPNLKQRSEFTSNNFYEDPEFQYQLQSNSDFDEVYEENGVVGTRFSKAKYDIFMMKLNDYCPISLEAYNKLLITYCCDSCLKCYNGTDKKVKVDFSECTDNSKCIIFREFQKREKGYTLDEFLTDTSLVFRKALIMDNDSISFKTGAIFYNTRYPDYQKYIHEICTKEQLELFLNLFLPKSYTYGLQYISSQIIIDDLRSQNKKLTSELAQYTPHETINLNKRIMINELFKQVFKLIETNSDKQEIIDILRVIKKNFESYVF